MMVRRVLRASAVASLLVGHPLVAQDEEPSLPALPTREGSFTATSDGVVIGTGVLVWTRRGLEQLSVYIWTSATDGSSVTDSLASYPLTLRPVREVRITGDTSRTIIYGRDTMWITTTVGDVSQTARAAAPAMTMHAAASLPLLAATMPFTAGARRMVLAYHAPPSALGARYVPLVVEGPEVVDGLNAWRITAGTPGGGTTFWVDARTRAILRWDVQEGAALVKFR